MGKEESSFLRLEESHISGPQGGLLDGTGLPHSPGRGGGPQHPPGTFAEGLRARGWAVAEGLTCIAGPPSVRLTRSPIAYLPGQATAPAQPPPRSPPPRPTPPPVGPSVSLC